MALSDSFCRLDCIEDCGIVDDDEVLAAVDDDASCELLVVADSAEVG